MQYREDKHANRQLSLLGYGCMRFTRKTGKIDQQKAEQELSFALEQGVNYFDTAYVYPGSEEALGTFLAKGHRDKVNIATKLPHYFVKKAEDFERYFTEQLTRLKTDHVEYYLLHMLNEVSSLERLKSLGLLDWVAEKKASGQIGSLGFSFHGGTQSFLALVDAFDWDFCQIQYNYMDETSQAGRAGLQYAAQKGLPVIIMEPLRGGKLGDQLPKSAKQMFAREGLKRSPAALAFRWLYDQPEVTVVLSGMNAMEQVKENLALASEATVGCLTEEERRLLERLKAELNKTVRVGCTGCGYCTPCPAGVDIPNCFRCYNLRYTEGWYRGMKDYIMMTVMRKTPANASLCVGCGKCEKKCPQGIAIREELKQTTKSLEGLPFRIAQKIVNHKKLY